MGADLYGSFYYREGYNKYSVFRAYGLSWWQDVIPMLDAGNELKPAKAQALLSLLHARRSVYRDGYRVADPAVKKIYANQSRLLSRVLGDCVRSGQPIVCSL